MDSPYKDILLDSYIGHYLHTYPKTTMSNLTELVKRHVPDVRETTVTFRVNAQKLLNKQTKRTKRIEPQIRILYTKQMEKRVYNLTTKPFYEQGTDEWLKEREGLISASDCGAAVGADPYTTPQKLVRKKCGMEPPFKGNKFTEHGHKYEDIAAQLYQTKYLKHIYFFGLIRHPDPSITIGASPDGINEDGVMLEIKVPYSRIPNGIVPPHYEVQTQVQMEVCDLNENDFYECKISEYDSEMEYQMDGTDRHTTGGSIKGVFGEWFHTGTGKNVYMYPPMWCTTKESKEWVRRKEHEMKQTHLEYRFGTLIFWKLDMESLVRVQRDRVRMHRDMIPVFQQMWKDIQYHRTNGGKELGFNKPACDTRGSYPDDIEEQEKRMCSNTLSKSVFLDDSDND